MFSLSPLDFVPAQALKHEWLVSNGLGGFASSTAIGMNSRKYHGLLVAPIRGLSERHVMLSKFEENAEINGKLYPLSTNSYPGTYFPTGFQSQTGFTFQSHPTFTYSLNGSRLEKSVRMVHGKNTTVTSYRLVSGNGISLSIRPFLRPRPIHSDPQTGAAELVCKFESQGFSISTPTYMSVLSSFGSFKSAPEYYYSVQYETEAARGYPAAETLFSPGEFSARLSRGDELHICASLEGLTPAQSLDFLDRQSLRFTHLANSFSQANGADRTDFSDALLRAADSFLVSTEKHRGIVAGFHWFSEWGRDSMISLPGLLLSTGRYPLAREILISHASSMKDGLLPNFIDEKRGAHYTSADASFWFVNAVREYVEATGDLHFVRESLWRQMRSFLYSTIEGNSLVRMDADSLVRVSEPASTWMDARVGGEPVTPRKGKPIEINALWNSDLHFMLSLASTFSDRKAERTIKAVLEPLAESFQKFSSYDGGLMDVVEPNDATLRPNQIFAVSLSHSPLNELQQRHLFNLVRSKLFTPLGLRTLTPDSPHYIDTYSGGPEKRDSAYHNGMAWPWLLGAFYDAQLRIYPGSEPQILSSLKTAYNAMQSGCIGTLPEIYEPKSMRPEGAVSQAWSVAEILRIYAKVKRHAAQAQGRAVNHAEAMRA